MWIGEGGVMQHTDVARSGRRVREMLSRNVGDLSVGESVFWSWRVATEVTRLYLRGKGCWEGVVT